MKDIKVKIKLTEEELFSILGGHEVDRHLGNLKKSERWFAIISKEQTGGGV